MLMLTIVNDAGRDSHQALKVQVLGRLGFISDPPRKQTTAVEHAVCTRAPLADSLLLLFAVKCSERKRFLCRLARACWHLLRAGGCLAFYY